MHCHWQETLPECRFRILSHWEAWHHPGYYHETCLYPALSCCFFQVENPSQFIQGYRVLFRQTSGLPSPGPWQIQDLKVASERNMTLSGLKKGIVYEIKVRPYFNEFQGADSESMTARTMEEGKSQINPQFSRNCSLLSVCCKKLEIVLCLSRMCQWFFLLSYLGAAGNGSVAGE